MSIIKIPTCFYRQCDADYQLPIPAEGYGGWDKTEAENVFPGINNMKDISLNADKVKFFAEAMPLDNEGIAENDEQLFALCREYDINHLIYTGFAIDGCLLIAPGGMLDMSRKGILCSAIREAVTAIENKETARHELCKEIALWRVAVMFGFVYNLDEFIDAIVQERV